jgi:drug/metabolite transporter (DMT)-like permease
MKQKNKKITFLFGKRNYTWMLIGLAFVALGFVLMAGGKSDDPKVFNEAIYNFRRIRLAPTLVLIGFAIEGIRNFKKPRQKNYLTGGGLFWNAAHPFTTYFSQRLRSISPPK